jgi:protein O-mannosyl-transferase
VQPTIDNKKPEPSEYPAHNNGVLPSHASVRRPLTVLFALTLGVMLIALVTMHPVISCTALSFDDNEYIVDNPLVRNPGLESVGRFFAEVLEPSTVPGYYQPLAMASLMLDVAAGGHPDNLRPFHRTGLLLHVLCTGLVILLTYQLFGHTWAAAAVGLLFGLHPAATEVIPWVAQRKTLLATFFSLLCLVSYIHFARWREWGWYGVSLLMLVLALLSKPTAVPIVVVLFLLDWWPLNRLNLRTTKRQPASTTTPNSRRTIWHQLRPVLIEKLPFIVMAIAFAIITYVSQSRTAGTFVTLHRAWWHGPLILGYTLSFYPRQLFWPVGWPGYYSFPDSFTLSNPSVALYVLAGVLLLGILILTLRWSRAWMAGWLAYFSLLFPTLGLIGFTDVLAANRFLYLPMIALTWPVASCLARRRCDASSVGAVPPEFCPTTLKTDDDGHASGTTKPGNQDKNRRQKSYGLYVRNWIAVVIVALLALAEGRASRSALVPWQDTLTLNRHLAASAPNAPKVRYNLGNALSEAGLSDQALREYRAAIELASDYVEAYNNLGEELVQVGRALEGLPLIRRAIELSPENPNIRNNYGAALLKLGHTDEAITSFREAVRINSDFADAHFNIALVLFDRGQWSDAASAFLEVLRINPDDPDAHARLGYIYEQLGQSTTAVKHYSKAVELDPSQHVAAERLRLLNVLP